MEKILYVTIELEWSDERKGCDLLNEIIHHKSVVKGANYTMTEGIKPHSPLSYSGKDRGEASITVTFALNTNGKRVWFNDRYPDMGDWAAARKELVHNIENYTHIRVKASQEVNSLNVDPFVRDFWV